MPPVSSPPTAFTNVAGQTPPALPTIPRPTARDYGNVRPQIFLAPFGLTALGKYILARRALCASSSLRFP